MWLALVLCVPFKAVRLLSNRDEEVMLAGSTQGEHPGTDLCTRFNRSACRSRGSILASWPERLQPGFFFDFAIRLLTGFLSAEKDGFRIGL